VLLRLNRRCSGASISRYSKSASRPITVSMDLPDAGLLSAVHPAAGDEVQRCQIAGIAGGADSEVRIRVFPADPSASVQVGPSQEGARRALKTHGSEARSPRPHTLMQTGTFSTPLADVDYSPNGR
jgi:hypothetical protein